MVSPSALAALRLMINSNLVGSCIGRSAGLVPFAISSTYSPTCRDVARAWR